MGDSLFIFYEPKNYRENINPVSLIVITGNEFNCTIWFMSKSTHYKVHLPPHRSNI